nr:MAG TPA: hypothetical protein [Caudoviricetes sp.]
MLSSQKRAYIQMCYLWKIMGMKGKKWTLNKQKTSYQI